MPLQDSEESWILTFGEKKQIYDTMLVKVGGKNEADDELAGPKPTIKSETSQYWLSVKPLMPER